MRSRIKHWLVLTCAAAALLISSNCAAQSLERSVASTAGEEISAGGISLEFTVGETVIGEVTNSNIGITQGFNQSTKKQSGSVPNTDLNLAKVYPNPFTSVFSIEAQDLKEYSVYALDGKLILSSEAITSGKFEVNMSEHENGVYILKATSTSGTQSTQRLVKI